MEQRRGRAGPPSEDAAAADESMTDLYAAVQRAATPSDAGSASAVPTSRAPTHGGRHGRRRRGAPVAEAAAVLAAAALAVVTLLLAGDAAPRQRPRARGGGAGRAAPAAALSCAWPDAGLEGSSHVDADDRAW